MVNKVTHTRTHAKQETQRKSETYTQTRTHRETRQQSCPTLAIVKNVKWMFYLTLTFMWFLYCGFIIIASCCCCCRKVFNRLTIKTADRNNWKQLRTYKQQKQRENERKRHGNSSTLIQREALALFINKIHLLAALRQTHSTTTHPLTSQHLSAWEREREGETVSDSSTFLAWPPTRRAEQSRATTHTKNSVCLLLLVENKQLTCLGEKKHHKLCVLSSYVAVYTCAHIHMYICTYVHTCMHVGRIKRCLLTLKC